MLPILPCIVKHVINNLFYYLQLVALSILQYQKFSSTTHQEILILCDTNLRHQVRDEQSFCIFAIIVLFPIEAVVIIAVRPILAFSTCCALVLYQWLRRLVRARRYHHIMKVSKPHDMV